ncbi:hypothetical protein [Aquimarina agarilytica]|uniref:hypothetical protein n=1 Tax=Aquimarina agarilytica TaxID=1087449 RepID=UPI000287D26D|nr:hypothetical protein [Aquimarina agarilytica]
MSRSTNSNLKKIIIDYKKLDHDVLDLLVEKYPDGYNDNDIVKFKNAKNETFECVEISDGETLYMVKISAKLEQKMEDHDLDNDFLDEPGTTEFDY